MKLVEIKDVRPGQIWKREDEYRLIVSFDDEPKNIAGNSFYAEYGGNINLVSDFEDMFSLEDIVSSHSLIGFLGITHEIKDNKLVEIPRAEFEVDDVVQLRDGTQRQYTVQRKGVVIKDTFPNSKCYQCFHYVFGIRNIFDFEIKKIGILGMTHEFVNERLVK